MSFEKSLVVGNEGQVYPVELEPLKGLPELAHARALEGAAYPDVYPGEEEAARGLIGVVKDLWQARKEGQEAGRECVKLLIGIINAWRKGRAPEAEQFVYKNLAELISSIVNGEVEDFDKFPESEYGDTVLALLGQWIGSRELIQEAMPDYKREVFYPEGQDPREAEEKGVILFVCGYGATTEPYKGIFEQFDLPVVAYQLPHGIINENPDLVGQEFDRVYAEMQNDPLLPKVTHVIGNSIGTMFASRLAVDLCKENERNVHVALVQTGANYQGALEKANSKFARQFRRELETLGLTLENFSKATEKYNPIELIDEFAEYISKGQCKLTLCVGLGDLVISPASEELEPLLKALDASKAKNNYDAFTSEVAAHNSGMLFFLWLATQKATEWSRVCAFFNPETDTIGTPEALEKYHRRRSKRRVEHLATAPRAPTGAPQNR